MFLWIFVEQLAVIQPKEQNFGVVQILEANNSISYQRFTGHYSHSLPDINSRLGVKTCKCID